MPDDALGTQLRHLLDAMDADVASACADVGLRDYRPRYSPVVRALLARGPCSIRDLATAIGVTHSAASQTAAQMYRRGLVSFTSGEDARERIVALTAEGRALLPAIQAEWTATRAAVRTLDAELPCRLHDLVAALQEALDRRPLRARIADAAADLDPPYRDRLARR